MKIAVSYLSSKYKEKDSIKKIDESDADYIHVDLMDGKFAGIKNFTIKTIESLLSKALKPLDVHLMTFNPDKYYKNLAMLNTEYITFHVEAVKNVDVEIQKVKDFGIKVGIAINPDTDINVIKNYLKKIDKVLIMSVVPGKGGQEFLLDTLSKIDELISLKDEFDYDFEIEIDGGINDASYEYLKDKKIDTLVSGHFICQSDDFNTQIKKLK